MEYNPYRARLQDAKSALQVFEWSKQEQTDVLAWLHGFDVDTARVSLSEAQDEVEDLKRQIWAFDHVQLAHILSHQSISIFDRIRMTMAGTRPSPAPQKDAKEREEKLEVVKASLATLSDTIIDLRHKIQLHSVLDWIDADTEIAELSREINKLLPEVRKLEAGAARFDEYLVEPLKQLAKLKSELATAIETRDLAQTFDKRFQESKSNRAAVSQIRTQCQAMFGSYNTDSVLRIKAADVVKLEREIAKCRERLNDLWTRESRVINRIVIDGNNLSYLTKLKGGPSKFIGPGPLAALIPVIRAAHPNAEIIVVFDPGYVRRTGTTAVELLSLFPSDVQIFEVGKGQKADETVIELASSPTSYAISNDRFRDFESRPLVSDRRVFPHCITQTSILVHDLWVSVQYRPDPMAHQAGQNTLVVTS
ncbi:MULTISPECIES: hypothetical protein [Pseudomonas]|uniref:Uncharacterized protein n=1 Tax=Pseudomonas poae TaxID=200451 RepID=A0ABY0RBT4_9PSED|nr:MULTISPECIES: hypothetical protein [Pseudomonas]KRP45149.1 hypothetical protein TU75_20770 [Pseudomonas poae]MDX9669014.1 hypothetical protein [Pseudomonas sp. P8_250]WPN36935.1 hypothetical protein QMK53_04600 [Pseudomonas sp. P8_139]WPN41264.1 hypothetical protein QMK55_26780 [Pseudomonas sp. P8_229]SDN55581.1 hypothetical protein SAMN04490208_0684 [Pseudomonas poae]